MPIGLYITLLALLICYIGVTNLIKNQDLNKDYPEDIQVKLKFIYKNIAKIVLFCVGVIKVDEEVGEVDYSKFLGPGYKSPKDFNTIVANHSSYFDIIYTCTRYFTSFVSKKEIGDSALGVYSNALKTIYYDGSKGKESAELCVSQLDFRNKKFKRDKEIFKKVINSNSRYFQKERPLTTDVC